MLTCLWGWVDPAARWRWECWVPAHRREIIVRGQSYGWRLPKYWQPIPLTARRVGTPRLWCGGRTHSPGGEGCAWGVNILEDVRHSSVLYVCKYFVLRTYTNKYPFTITLLLDKCWQSSGFSAVYKHSFSERLEINNSLVYLIYTFDKKICESIYQTSPYRLCEILLNGQ